MMRFVIQERWCIRDVWEVFDCGLYVFDMITGEEKEIVAGGWLVANFIP